MRLTASNYAAFREMRRRYAPKRGLGPGWTVLGSEVLFAALELAHVTAQDLLDRMARTGDPAHLGDRSPLRSRLEPHLPSLASIRARLGLIEIRFGSTLVYAEDAHRPTFTCYGMSLPEQVVVSLRGHRLSQVCELSSMPALAEIDPAILRARNAAHAATGCDVRLELDLDVEWRPFAARPTCARSSPS